jgi:hypothetical protein
MIMGYSRLLNWARSIFQHRLGGRHHPANCAVKGPQTIAGWCPSRARPEPLESRDEQSTINVNDIRGMLLRATQTRW